MTELWEHDASELADRVRAGELSALNLLELSLDRIERFDPRLNAMCFLDPDRARSDAERVDRRVAAGDGGGSIRIPSSYSGLFGMKTTFGLLGAGPEPFNSSMTSVHGPIVRSVRDAARYLDATAGPTPTDPTSLPAPPVPFEDLVTSGEATERLRGKRTTRR